MSPYEKSLSINFFILIFYGTMKGSSDSLLSKWKDWLAYIYTQSWLSFILKKMYKTYVVLKNIIITESISSRTYRLICGLEWIIHDFLVVTSQNNIFQLYICVYIYKYKYPYCLWQRSQPLTSRKGMTNEVGALSHTSVKNHFLLGNKKVFFLWS